MTTGARPLKIAIVSQYFWPETFPINQLAEALAARGHQVEVLTGLPNYPGGRIRDGYGIFGPWREARGGITIKRVPLISRGDTRLRLALNYASFALSSLLFSLARLRGDYDVILANQASPLFGVVGALPHRYLRGKPMVLWIQDLWPDSLHVAGVRSKWIWRISDRLMQLCYNKSSLVMVQSRAFADHAARYGLPQDRLVFVPNWAEPQYRVLEAADTVGPDRDLPEGLRFLIAGNLGEAQCIPTLVKAAAALKGHPAIRIIVIGDGRMRPWLESEIARLQLSPTLTYLGYRPPETMPGYLAASDAALLLLRKDETMARTIPSRLQAFLACGRPVIAALDGEAKRIVVEAGAGLGAAAGDADALKDAILRFAALSPVERAEMAAASAACYRREFEPTMIIDRVEKALRSVARKRAERAP